MDTKFRDAQALAKFSNLVPNAPKGSEEDVEYFRQNYPGFVPQVWWKWRVSSKTDPVQFLWEAEQKTLHDAWKESFPLEDSVRLISTGPPIPEAWIEESEKAWAALGVGPGVIAPEAIVLPNRPPAPVQEWMATVGLEPDMWIKSPVWPYQRAVMFLATEPWRARFCESCGKRYVAFKPGRRYCSDRCTQAARRGSKRASWHKHSRKWRPKKTRKSRKSRK